MREITRNFGADRRPFATARTKGGIEPGLVKRLIIATREEP